MLSYAFISPISPWWAAFLAGWVAASVFIGVGAFFLYRRQLPSTPPAVSQPAEEAETPAEDTAEMDMPMVEAELPESEPPREGPGPLFIRFKALQTEFDQAVKEMQRFNGAREVQLQGWQTLCTDVIRRVLPVLENLQPYLEDEDGTLADVAQMASGRLLTELITVGVTRFTPLPGDPFDARYHQLLANSGGTPPYRVRTVVAPGYLFRPRVPGAGEVVLKVAEVMVEGQTADASAVTEEAANDNTERVSEQV